MVDQKQVYYVFLSLFSLINGVLTGTRYIAH